MEEKTNEGFFGMNCAKRYLEGNLEKPEDEYRSYGGPGSSSLQGKSMNRVGESNLKPDIEEDMEDK